MALAENALHRSHRSGDVYHDHTLAEQHTQHTTGPLNLSHSLPPNATKSSSKIVASREAVTNGMLTLEEVRRPGAVTPTVSSFWRKRLDTYPIVHHHIFSTNDQAAPPLLPCSCPFADANLMSLQTRIDRFGFFTSPIEFSKFIIELGSW